MPIEAWLGQRSGTQASSIAQLEALESQPRQQEAASANGAPAWDVAAPQSAAEPHSAVDGREDTAVGLQAGAAAGSMAPAEGMQQGRDAEGEGSGAYSLEDRGAAGAGSAGSAPEWEPPSNGAADGYAANGKQKALDISCPTRAC